MRRTAPHRFTTSGTVVPPAGVSRTAACAGRVAVQVKAGRDTISTRRVGVTGACRFRSRLALTDRHRLHRHRRVRFFVRFSGNAVLASRTLKPIVRRVR